MCESVFLFSDMAGSRTLVQLHCFFILSLFILFYFVKTRDGVQ